MYIYCNTVHIYLMLELFSFIRSKQSHFPFLLLSLTLQVMSEPEKSGTQKTAPFQGDPMTYSCESWLLMITQVSSSLFYLGSKLTNPEMNPFLTVVVFSKESGNLHNLTFTSHRVRTVWAIPSSVLN